MGKDYELLNTPQAQAILAEVVADVSSRFIVTELFRRRQTTEVFDADRICREHYKWVTRFLPRLQRALIGNIGLIELKRKRIA